MMGKARVAPRKPITIPHLELTAATLAVQVDTIIKKELQIPLSESKFWTDSTTVLKYIANEKNRFKTFVVNRIATILQGSRVEQWRYISSRLNPADYASRGQRVSVFTQNKEWISGPAFLSKPESEWPDQHFHLEELTVVDPEAKKGILVNCTTVEENTDVMQQLTEHFSSWIRLKKVVAWLTSVKGTLVNLSKKRKEMNESYKDQEQVNKEMTSYKRSLKQTYLTLDEDNMVHQAHK